MALNKPNEYKEVSARQSEETVYAEDINQIISNIEKIKGGQANEAPVATIKDIHERLLVLESGSVIKPPSDPETPPVQEDTTNKEEPPKEPTYDFPRFKVEIPETIDFIVGEKQTISIKKIDNNYFMQYKFMSLFMPSIDFMLYQKETNLYKTYSLINQFFQTVSNSEEIYYDALEGEIVWEEITNLEELLSNPNFILPDGSFNFDLIKTNPLQVQSKFKITNGVNSVNYLMIKNEALEEIPPETYCVLTLNIKNRVLRNEDTNIFASSHGFMTTQKIIDFYHFTLEQNNNSVILKGEYTLKEGAGVAIGFYSPIIENYFDVLSGEVDLKNTTGITSSNDKPLKYSFFKNTKTGIGDPPYFLFLQYQDGEILQAGETIIFNLIPDKNYTLDLIN